MDLGSVGTLGMAWVRLGAACPIELERASSFVFVGVLVGLLLGPCCLPDQRTNAPLHSTPLPPSLVLQTNADRTIEPTHTRYCSSPSPPTHIYTHPHIHTHTHMYTHIHMYTR